VRRLVAVLCLAEVLGMAGFAAFPALLPQFLAEWSLSNTQAGWISGIYLAGYMASVPVLASLTDRIDARRVYLMSQALTGLSLVGFALLAEGFWTALVFQTGAGIGLAGTYMPGLKILADRITGPRQSRFVSFYTACFSIGAGLSYFAAGEVAARFGWRWAFAAAACGALAALVVAWRALPEGEARNASPPATALLDFRPVLRSRATMAYVLGYAAHMWELFGLRAWIVAFLVFSQGLQPAGGRPISATAVAALAHVIMLAASIGGNELAVRFGRRPVLIAVMSGSALMSFGIGFSASLPYGLVVGLCFLYAVAVAGDSAALTAGTVAAAPEGYRGAAMAVHSTLGFGSGFLGSLAVGIVLDLAGDGMGRAWGLAFVTMGLGCALGPLALALLGRGRR